jgi:transposase
MKARVNIKDRNALRLKAVNLVLNGARPDEVAESFGVSRASVFNWVRDYKDGGPSKVARMDGDKRFTLPGLTAQLTLRLVRAVIDRHPEWSADKLSEHLESLGHDIPARTVRNIFIELGAASAKERQQKAYVYQSNILHDQIFSEAELEEILTEQREPLFKELRGNKLGDVFVQDRIKIPAAMSNNSLVLELIVDTFMPWRCIYAAIGEPLDALSLDLLKKVTQKHLGKAFIPMVCTPRKSMYDSKLYAMAYPNWIREELKGMQYVRNPKEKGFDSRIKAARDLIWDKWFKPLKKANEFQLTSTVLNDSLQNWLVNWRSVSTAATPAP